MFVPMRGAMLRFRNRVVRPGCRVLVFLRGALGSHRNLEADVGLQVRRYGQLWGEGGQSNDGEEPESRVSHIVHGEFPGKMTLASAL